MPVPHQVLLLCGQRRFHPSINCAIRNHSDRIVTRLTLSQSFAILSWLPLADRRYQDSRLQGQVYYAEDRDIDIPASAVDHRFREVVKGLISRLASKTPARKAPSTAECRFCPISSQYCPDRREE